jgi:thiosulfate dehydrogenase (quinone) large subunit
LERITHWLQSSKAASFLLTVVRVWLGWLWISSGIEKLWAPEWVGQKSGVAILGFVKHAMVLTQSTPQNPHPSVQEWYAAFLNQAVFPNASLFSYFVTIGEILVGVCLILGLFTTFAAAIGAFMNLNYMLGGSVSTNPGMIIGEFVLLIGALNACVYGVDNWITPSLRRRKLASNIKLPIGEGA